MNYTQVYNTLNKRSSQSHLLEVGKHPFQNAGQTPSVVSNKVQEPKAINSNGEGTGTDHVTDQVAPGKNTYLNKTDENRFTQTDLLNTQNDYYTFGRDLAHSTYKQNWITKLLNWIRSLFTDKGRFSYHASQDTITKKNSYRGPITEQQLVKVASMLKYYR